MNNLVTLRIIGSDPRRFCNGLYKRGVRFYFLDFNGKVATVTVGYHDYLVIKKIKTIYKIEVLEVRGLLSLKKHLQTYKIFYFALLVGIFFLYFLSNLIFYVEVIHDKQEIRNFIKKELEKRDVKKYSFIKSFDENERIVNSILDEYNEKIEWMEITRVGTKYIIRVDIRKVVEEDEDNIPRNIIARKKGIIMSINSTQGEVVKKVNDYVNPGDVIISGTIKNKEEIKDYVRSEGKVFAEVWYQVKVEVPNFYKETKYTGNNKKVLSFKFLNNDIRFFSSFKEKEDNVVFSVSNLLLPISFSYIKENEMEIVDALYSYDMALLKAQNEARSKLVDTLGKNDVIIYEKSLKNYEKDSKIVVEMFFKVKEDITSYQNIDITSIENDAKQEE